MAKDRNGSLPVNDSEEEAPSNRDRAKKTKRKIEETDDSNGEDTRNKKRRSKRRSRRRHRDDHSSSSYSSSSEHSSSQESESDGSDSEESESERRRRKKKERRRRKEKEYERERRRRKEKERKRKREKEGSDEKKKKEKHKKKKKRKEKEEGRKGAVTNSWGKYGIIRETDMWNKRPEFTAWLAEVKQVNLETLPNWEEKQMFKEFMEDHNTATFPSKKYYDLDAYHRHMMDKEMKKGLKKVSVAERTVFNDEEQRRQELQIERERQKEEQVEALKRSMQSGMGAGC
eukprot:TRINITY_DN16858_c0_g1_i2.p1 TRINITY_DN16858_c0_g1~~TRINITY_DN16858_c0_g1_i2.p1  ORF type:complete len:287 (+),score=80.33 TRINITY_DN16858_c0_g1_i2:199-1059(+)